MNIHPVVNNVRSRITLNSDEADLIASCFKPIALKRKKKLLLEHELNDKIYFIEKGLLYAYKTLESGDVQVIQFAKEDGWISDLYSYLTDKKSLFGIKSLEDCNLWMASKHDLEAVYKSIPKFESFARIVFQTAYSEALLKISNFYSFDAVTKYKMFLDQSRSLFQRVPLYLIASYLGIKPGSLSRIRKQII
ncbi:cyclic nucleotide-binding domain-containing protein [Chryseobacterium sp. Chry.R1]|uniref:Crp/Fnr family transcriptional regulator n=1 Tax=Chryseobacterium sp. Chry.R1 TaxID=3139392 RepID=UPI0031F74D84